MCSRQVNEGVFKSSQICLWGRSRNLRGKHKWCIPLEIEIHTFMSFLHLKKHPWSWNFNSKTRRNLLFIYVALRSSGMMWHLSWKRSVTSQKSKMDRSIVVVSFVTRMYQPTHPLCDSLWKRHKNNIYTARCYTTVLSRLYNYTTKQNKWLISRVMHSCHSQLPYENLDLGLSMSLRLSQLKFFTSH